MTVKSVARAISVGSTFKQEIAKVNSAKFRETLHSLPDCTYTYRYVFLKHKEVVEVIKLRHFKII